MGNKRLLNETEAASYIGLSRSFLQKARTGCLPAGAIDPPVCVRVGSRAVRYDISDLDTWIEGLKQKSLQQNGGYQ